jgi:hypothetical protein
LRVVVSVVSLGAARAGMEPSLGQRSRKIHAKGTGERGSPLVPRVTTKAADRLAAPSG